MRGDKVALLKYEASVKPAIKELLDGVLSGQLSEADIDQAVTPLPWYKDALKTIVRSNKARSHQLHLEHHISQSTTTGHVPDPLGEMVQWIHGNSFVPQRRNGSSSIEIKDGGLIFIPDDSKGMWYENCFFDYVDERIKECVSQGKMTKTQYTAAYQKKWAVDAGITEAQLESSSKPLFRITRIS